MRRGSGTKRLFKSKYEVPDSSPSGPSIKTDQKQHSKKALRLGLQCGIPARFQPGLSVLHSGAVQNSAAEVHKVN